MDVKKERCDQCLFSPNKIVSKERMAEVIQGCRRDDSYFICHKSSMEGGDACCRGFYDTQSTNLLRIMKRLNGINFVE